MLSLASASSDSSYAIHTGDLRKRRELESLAVFAADDRLRGFGVIRDTERRLVPAESEVVKQLRDQPRRSGSD
jgi:hypothetical protein